jgi:hypothetical protein
MVLPSTWKLDPPMSASSWAPETTRFIPPG